MPGGNASSKGLSLPGATLFLWLAATGALVQDRRIVRDGNLITSASPGTAIDVAFLLLEILTSRENAENIRELMGFA